MSYPLFMLQPFHYNPLHEAVRLDRYEMVEFMLSQGLDVNGINYVNLSRPHQLLLFCPSIVRMYSTHNGSEGEQPCDDGPSHEKWS